MSFLRDFAWMLRRHEEGILAYIDLWQDNGAIEAVNNNAKTGLPRLWLTRGVERLQAA